MSEIYRASKWKVDVRQLKDLQQLAELVMAQGGKFSILPAFCLHEAMSVNDKLLVCIDQDNWMQILDDVIKLGFSSWFETEADVFTDELAFNPFRMSKYSQRTWEARLAVAHQHNFPRRPKSQDSSLYDKPICPDGGSDVRVFNSLKRTGIVTIGDVLDMLERGPDAMLAIQKLSGGKSLDELVEILRDKGYLKDE
jgi:hypothetical protein